MCVVIFLCKRLRVYVSVCGCVCGSVRSYRFIYVYGECFPLRLCHHVWPCGSSGEGAGVVPLGLQWIYIALVFLCDFRTMWCCVLRMLQMLWLIPHCGCKCIYVALHFVFLGISYEMHDLRLVHGSYEELHWQLRLHVA